MTMLEPEMFIQYLYQFVTQEQQMSSEEPHVTPGVFAFTCSEVKCE